MRHNLTGMTHHETGFLLLVTTHTCNCKSSIYSVIFITINNFYMSPLLLKKLLDNVVMTIN